MISKITSVFSGLIILLILFPCSLAAQKFDVKNLDQLLTSTNKTRVNIAPADIEQLRSLVYDLNPTIYLEDQQIKNFSDKKPVKAEIYPNSLNLLYADNSLFQSVELLVFKINSLNDFSTPMDISALGNFQNLKFIYVECTFNCNASHIQTMFTNIGDITMLYLVTTPE